MIVDDEIFKEYFSDDFACEGFLPISFSDYAQLKINSDKNDLTASVAACIDEVKALALTGENHDFENERFFYLKSNYYFPSVAADFSKDVSINSPDLNLSITDAKNLPKGNRAVPVNEKYAGDGGYDLEEIVYARCRVFIPSFSKSVFDWCKNLFSKKKEKMKTTFVASVGDVMVARGVQEILMDDENGLEKVFTDTLPILQKNDIAIANLEGVVPESFNNANKTYVFKFHKEVLPVLKNAGFNYLVQANNHCYDYGEQGFKDTLKAFEEYDIHSSGIGYNEEQAKKFYHASVNGMNFSIISCGAFPLEYSGFNGKRDATATETRAGILWESDDLRESIKKEKAAGNFVIVNIHGGDEYFREPTKNQRELYEKFIDCGADVVFGSHPHVLQPTEWKDDKLIIYSLGNFIFNRMENMAYYGALDTEIVRLGIVDGRIVYTEIYPAKINGTSVSLKHP